MASSLETADEPEAKAAARRAAASSVDTDAESYLDRHMGFIFGEGFSFSGFERNRLFLADGRSGFLDLSVVSGADSPADSRAVIVWDPDDDGDPDLFVTAIQGPSHLLFRNDVGTATGHGFLKARLLATKGPPQAVGAIVRVRAGGRLQTRSLSAGSGFLSQHPGELLFGLGAAKEATLEVRWPGRAVERFGVVRAGSRVRLVEGTGRPAPIRRSVRPAATKER